MPGTAFSDKPQGMAGPEVNGLSSDQITAVGDNGSLFPHSPCLSSCFSTHCLVCFAYLEVLRIELGALYSRRHSADRATPPTLMLICQ